MRHIVALSGGIASAWVADYVLREISPNAILYFNDTKWEDKDLYRFLNDLQNYLEHYITYDSDGRNPEEVFYDQNMLANNRVPLCSKILKAERLQKFAKPGDVLYFGIDTQEIHRCERIANVYRPLGIECKFPMVELGVFKPHVFQWLKDTGIKMPRMYELGFSHNNCAGGCVRSGKRQWLHLLRTLPDVYAERERVETEFSLLKGKQVSYMKDMSLKELRELNEKQRTLDFEFDDSDTVTECVGICGLQN
jgi:hypothetical protein